MFMIPKPKQGHTLLMAVSYFSALPEYLFSLTDYAAYMLFSDDGSGSAPDFNALYTRHDTQAALLERLRMVSTTSYGSGVVSLRDIVGWTPDQLQQALYHRYVPAMNQRMQDAYSGMYYDRPVTTDNLVRDMTCRLFWRHEDAEPSEWIAVEEWSYSRRVVVSSSLDKVMA